MATFRLVGSDTIIINRAALVDFAHGEVGKITFSTDIATVKTGKNLNAIFASNASGDQATMEIRVLRGTADDVRLNSIVTTYRNDPVAFTLVSGSFSKKLGAGDGSVISDLYTFGGGVPTKNPEAISNVEGDVEQAITLYTFQFASAARIMSTAAPVVIAPAVV